MTTIVTRAGKGSPLTHTEVDTNFTNLNTNKLETAAIPLGTLAAPSISFLSDANTGIYSPGADTVAFVTAGSNRVHITSAGLVGIGTTSPGSVLHARLPNTSTATIATFDRSDGAVSSEIHYDGSDGRITFGTTTNHPLSFETNNTRAVTIDSSQRVGIGTTSPTALLDVRGSGTVAYFLQNTGSSGISIGVDTNLAKIGTNGSTCNLAFNIDGAEKARLDTSGRLLVGTSTSVTGSNTQYGKLQILGNTAGATSDGRVIIGRGESVTSSGTGIGQICFTDSTAGEFANIKCESDAASGSSDYPGRLVFSTCPDSGSSPVERMRIANNGVIQARNVAGDTLNLYNAVSAGSSNAFIYGLHSSASVYAGTTSFIVYTNGNVVNTNGSYTTISDAKLKENIVDAGSQWDDFKAIQIRNWNFKAETGHETHRQIGPIAQELETVCPGLVFETPDRDPKGNDLGTTTKGVNQSVLYMKAVKALQEAMGRIETLEARLTAAGID